MKNLLLFGLAVFVLNQCSLPDGEVAIFNDTSQPECNVPVRVDSGTAFSVEVGELVRFNLGAGSYTLSLAGPPPSGCFYSGDFTFDNSCDFEVESDETTVIRLVDDPILGLGSILVGCG